ncbi:alanine-glyoxylate aminotransferase 2-like 1 [Nannochloropsis gaditana]|uniref:Alanine-glyoxylate aminotransferase 2-like 1 n=1 Tax=Nannochloropsis gaditana TaxID=72520 RepID=W7TX76_9STRA|nr:alanine-glyoxylate aminotransferase 2-like 1 [Nannochloropsis gaditana]
MKVIQVCHLHSSMAGSEANDLALALARAYTGHEDAVVLDSAYHGHTTTMIDMSPYKHKGARPASHLNSAAAKEGQELKEIPDGQFPLPRHSTPCLPSSKDWVHVVPVPDTYRGRFSTAADYVNHSMALLDTSTASASHDLTAPNSLSNRGVRKIAAFCAESVLACGGQVVLPPGYLSGMYEYIHSKGGLCVADEVQTGFGRSGSHMWAFQSQDVVPDIVTLGKPIANGFPLAAVITRKEIAESLPISYFNTFGGSNLAVALGEATLDVILGDNLQEKAARLGALLKNLFESLKKKHSLVGDVRGLGMMLGVELVEDRETKAPAPAAAAYVLERARQMGVHIQVDGKWENVLKMKPPLAFMEEDAQTLVKTIDIALAEYAQRMGEMNGE